jgi:hypothetical protein
MLGHYLIWLHATWLDPSWRGYGVMTMLTIEVMQWALRSDYEVVNLSCGDDRGKSLAPLRNYLHARTRKVARAARAFGNTIFPST